MSPAKGSHKRDHNATFKRINSPKHQFLVIASPVNIENDQALSRGAKCEHLRELSTRASVTFKKDWKRMRSFTGRRNVVEGKIPRKSRVVNGLDRVFCILK